MCGLSKVRLSLKARVATPVSRSVGRSAEAMELGPDDTPRIAMGREERDGYTTLIAWRRRLKAMRARSFLQMSASMSWLGV